MKVEIEIVKVSSARKIHTCAYCNAKINSGQSYTKLMSRLEEERFPVQINICSTHQAVLVPLSLVLRR
jgi:biotin synthase-related radical SAM superfamily protein